MAIPKGSERISKTFWELPVSTLYRTREVSSNIFGRSSEDLGMRMVYDIAHNTAKLERRLINEKIETLLVHRKEFS